MTDTQTTTRTRRIDGRPVPAPGTYAIDPAHSSIEAVARHLMVSKVRGSFRTFEGSIEVAEDPAQSQVEVRIDAASIDTRNADRDTHLRSSDFLDVEAHPHITFTSTRVAPKSDGSWEVQGDLTIRGITRPVVLDTAYLDTLESPFGQTVAAFSATTEVSREDYGITWNQALEAGGVLVGPKVKVELEIQAALQE